MKDTNVYVMSNYGFKNSAFYYNASQFFSFYGFSGQLLYYKFSKNETYYNLTQATFSNLGSTNQTYQLAQFLSVYYFSVKQQYLIRYNNYSIDIQTWYFLQSVQYSDFHTINISVNANSLQVSYSLQPFIVTIGLSEYNMIYLFQYNNDEKSLISYSNYICEKEISNFIVAYNSIIILIEQQKEIKIMTFNFTNTFTLNQQTIDKLFNKIKFNPISIVMNTQQQSFLLFINNINEVLNSQLNCYFLFKLYSVQA